MARRWAGRAAYWRRMLKDWKASGLTASEFSRRRGICRPLLFVWRRRLEQKAASRRLSKRTRRAPFLPVHLVDSDSPLQTRSPIELTLRNGRQLRVPADFPPTSLFEWAAALASFLLDMPVRPRATSLAIRMPISAAWPSNLQRGSPDAYEILWSRLAKRSA